MCQDAFDYADLAAAELGISKADYLERLLLNEKRLTAANGGRAPWWPAPSPTDQEELDLKAS